MKVRASRAGDLLANSPDRLKAKPIRENLLASWRQSGQKQDPGPASPNHNATYKPRLSPYRDFANSIRPFLRPSNSSKNPGILTEGRARNRHILFDNPSGHGGRTHSRLDRFVAAYEADDVTQDGKLVIDDPAIRHKLVKATDGFTAAYHQGCTPPGSLTRTNIEKAFHAQA
jgi:hypothetical protein